MLTFLKSFKKIKRQTKKLWKENYDFEILR